MFRCASCVRTGKSLDADDPGIAHFYAAATGTLPKAVETY
jgi:hypothetical protein